ncbi:hypothetical protein C8J57DRAFT_1494808 [Mycena rebaudengoi]|nr:hypothetical protein C8J57DRAFT_1494808 [Mycena rebaudengoi]
MASTKSFNIHSPSVKRSLVLVIVVVSLSLLFLSSSHLGHYITKETLFFSSSQYGAEKFPYRSNIAKVSVAFDGSESPTIQRAFETHLKHNAMHGYHHFIDRQRLVDEVFNPNPPWGAWSKPAYVLNILLTELAKPPEERLEWLFWFDADTIIANPTTPLEVFLPPNTKELESIHFIITSNMDGINDGVFAIRVHRWSVELMSAVVAYPTYFPQNVTASRFGEQSALEWLLKSPDSPIQEVNSHWADAPARWFNALPFNNPVVPKENNIGILAVRDDAREVRCGYNGRVPGWE